MALVVGVSGLGLGMARAREEADLRREVAQLRRQAGEGMQSRIVGRTAAMQRLFDMIERVAPTRATVLVVGETGTGKELVARAIHDLSDRARRPFVAVNCSALPESLLESELFGHMKGSFTGAIQNKRGLFEEASGGTLFLDEISTVSAAIQVKLLRVLQERKIKRVGGREMVPVDFRLVAATMARNSRKFPRRGLGAEADFSPAILSQQAPKMAMMNPTRVWRVIRSLRKMVAPRATIRGSMAVIKPAWEAEVSSRALASKMKYMQGSQTAMKRRYFRSSLFITLWRSRL